MPNLNDGPRCRRCSSTEHHTWWCPNVSRSNPTVATDAGPAVSVLAACPASVAYGFVHSAAATQSLAAFPASVACSAAATQSDSVVVFSNAFPRRDVMRAAKAAISVVNKSAGVCKKGR